MALDVSHGSYVFEIGKTARRVGRASFQLPVGSLQCRSRRGQAARAGRWPKARLGARSAAELPVTRCQFPVFCPQSQVPRPYSPVSGSWFLVHGLDYPTRFLPPDFQVTRFIMMNPAPPARGFSCQ